MGWRGRGRGWLRLLCDLFFFFFFFFFFSALSFFLHDLGWLVMSGDLTVGGCYSVYISYD